MDVMSGSFNLVKPSSSQNLGRQHYMNYHLNIINGWAKSHFTLLKANKTKPNKAKKMGYASNKRPDLGVFSLMKNSLLFKYNILQMLSIAVEASAHSVHSTFHKLFPTFSQLKICTKIF